MMGRGIVLIPIAEEHQSLLDGILYQAIFVPPRAAPPPREIIRRPELSRYVQNWGELGDLGYPAVETVARTVVGAAWLRLLTGASAGRGHVSDNTPELAVALLPSYRNQRIGSRLLRALFAAAASRFEAISLSANQANPAARLYQRLGFKTVDRRNDTLVMQKQLGTRDVPPN